MANQSDRIESEPRGASRESGTMGDHDMSDFAQYPFQALQEVGRAGAGISEEIGSNSRNAFQVDGLTVDQDRISAALDHFRDAWEASLKKLGENIGGLGEISTQIGTMSAEFDGALAQALSPGGHAGASAAR